MDGANPAIGSVPKRVCCSDCCLSFSRSCHKLRSAKARRVFEAETHNLHHQVNLVEGYLGQLDAVFKGRVKSETLDELAVMLDTFRPLRLTRDAVEMEDEAYAYSWKTGTQGA